MSRPRNQYLATIATIATSCLLLTTVAALPAAAATAGPAAPGTAASVAGPGAVAWTNPNDAKTGNDTHAYAGLNNNGSAYLKLTNFGLAVPAGSTVNGVSFAVERSAPGSGDIRDTSVRIVKAGTVSGAERASAVQWPVSDAVAAYGSSSDLWGTTLSVADVNDSGFGIAIAAENVTSYGTFAKVDSVTVTVTYTPSGGGAPVNTVAPSVSGTAQSGQTLTASAGIWTGAATITYAYQWRRCNSSGASCANISGATSATFALTATDVGSTIRVQVTGTNGSGSSTATSANTAVVTAAGGGSVTAGPASPGTSESVTGPGAAVWASLTEAKTANNAWATAGLNNSASQYLKLTNFGLSIPSGATINGVSIAVDRMATAAAGDIRDESVKLVKGGTISGTEHAATGTEWPTADTVATYGSSSDLWGTTLTQADVTGSGFGVAIAARNLAGSGSFAKVDYVTITVTYTTGGGSGAPVNTSPPAISGSAVSGQTLTAGTGTWTGGSTITYAYQWQRCNSSGASCANVSGATGTSFVLSGTDIGSTMRVRVTATNGSGSTQATSAATAVVGGASSSWSATSYTEAIIANPAGAPYTSWTGVWTNPVDGTLWTAWNQSGGSLGSGMPTWAKNRVGGLYRGLEWDYWNLTNTRQYMSSSDNGATWSYQYPRGGVADTLVTPVDGASTATGFSGCSSTGATSGSGCSIMLPHAYTPQADFMLGDGTIIRRVNGEDMPYNLGVKGTAFLQRLAPGGTWSAPQYLLAPATYTYQISRIRRLSDDRLIAIGQKWNAPAGTRTGSSPAYHLLMVSSDNGTSWTEALTIGSGVTAPYVNEWDYAETGNGNLIAVFRVDGDDNPKQALLTKSGSSWVMSNVQDTPFAHSGHPELLRTAEGPILYIARDDLNGARGIWYQSNADAQAGNDNWAQLKFDSAGTGGNCTAVTGGYHCSSKYYPRSIQSEGDGTIVIVSHNGYDQPYPPSSNQYIYVQRFKLTTP